VTTRLLSLQLENIKSYGRSTRVEFSEGLNAVCGLNGAGKTTLLESIGYVLFDYLPYSVAGFLREKEKSGTMRLLVQATDDRQYEIVRRIGSGATWYVADGETGIRLAERAENVREWIRSELLNIEGAVDLSSLFQSAVGVAQGAMTADFVSTPSSRKSTFDSLLRVEEYRGAEKQLAGTVGYLKDSRNALQVQIGRLEGELERLPQIETRERQLATDLDTAERTLEKIQIEVRQVGEQKAEQDEAERRLNELRAELKTAETEVARCGEVLTGSEEARERARLARKTMDEAREGRDLYQGAQDRLKELESKRQERERLYKDAGKAETDVAVLDRELSTQRKNLEAAKAAGDQASRLAEAVDQQSELELKIRNTEVRSEGRSRLETEAGDANRELARLGLAISTRKTRIEEATAARDEGLSVEASTARLSSVRAELIRLEHLEKQKPEVEQEGKRLRQQMDGAQQDAKRAGELESRLAELDGACNEASRVREAHSRLREELAGACASLEFQAVARQELGNRHCPLLELECPVVTADGSVLTRFDARVKALQSHKDKLEHDLKGSEERVELAAAAENEAGPLRLELAKVSDASRLVDELEPQLRKTRTRYASLLKDLAERPKLLQEAALLEEEAKRVGARREVAASLPSLLEQQQIDEAAERDTRRRLASLEASRKDMEQLEVELQKFRDELESMQDPRSRRQLLTSLASQATEIERELGAKEAQVAESHARLASVHTTLQAYETLDAEMQEQREIESRHRPAYEAHLKSSEEAGRLEERELAVSQASERLESARNRGGVVRANEAQAAARYDAVRHEDLKVRHQDLRVEDATARQARDRALSDLSELQTELDELRQQQQRLVERQAELEETVRVGRAVDFIRETIAAAGPAVTEMLLASISQSAAVIYAEIMDDHASELRWDQDYEILVQKGTETRKFAQLSGGEQMSAALAVRLALLREMSEVDFAFFDEPTQNMDEDRRSNLAGQIGQIRGFEQLIVISHDDTFQHHTDNLIRLQKVHEQTLVEVT
jgi:exonuclease SbcC